MSSSDERILFVRIDRIGDLCLSLPADAAFPGQVRSVGGQPQAVVDWWVAENTGFVADYAVPARMVREVPRQIGWSGFFGLLRDARRRSYRAAVVFHAPWWVSLLLWMARIPVRISTRGQWHHLLFMNRKVRQNRSLAEWSELEYGFRLVEGGFGLEQNAIPRNPLELTIDREWQRETLDRLQLKTGEYVVIHPGMGGSARNWPTSHYIELARLMSLSDNVVITGTPMDAQYLEPMKSDMHSVPRVKFVDGLLSSSELLHVLEGASALVAPSTGVLHLGAALGAPVIGIYSPVRVQKARRWGPLGKKTTVIAPDVECPGARGCLGSQCAKFDCMEQINAADVLEKVREGQRDRTPR